MTTPSDVTFIDGACPHDCPDTCATITEVRDGRAVRFYAEKDHPVTQGWLCAKVRPYLEHVYHPERLQYPLRRVGAEGPAASGSGSRGRRRSTRSPRAGRRSSPSMARLRSSPTPTAARSACCKTAICSARLWNRMGASGLDRSICGAAAEMAVESTLGARWAPDPADVLHSKLVLIWGHNPASTGPHFMPLLRQAQKRGAHVIVIDPRRTLTARSADEHIQPEPATDGALALGMMHVIFAEQLHDEPWLEAEHARLARAARARGGLPARSASPRSPAWRKK